MLEPIPGAYRWRQDTPLDEWPDHHKTLFLPQRWPQEVNRVVIWGSQTTPPQWWCHMEQWWDPLKRGDRTPDMNDVQTTFSWNQQHRGGHCGSQEVVGNSYLVYEHQLLGAGVTSVLTWFAVEGKSFWLYSKMLLAVLQHRIPTPQKSKVKSWTVNLDCSSPFQQETVHKHNSTINAWMTTASARKATTSKFVGTFYTHHSNK